MKLSKTLEYYNLRAREFAQGTVNVDFSHTQGRFLDKLKQEVMGKILRALKANGLIYISFKYGTFEGERNGRYFIDMDEVGIEKFEKGFCIIQRIWA